LRKTDYALSGLGGRRGGAAFVGRCPTLMITPFQGFVWRELLAPPPSFRPAVIPSGARNLPPYHPPLLPLYGKNGGRFLRYARACLVRSGRNDGGGGAMRGGARRTASFPRCRRRSLSPSFRAKRGTSHLTTHPCCRYMAKMAGGSSATRARASRAPVGMTGGRWGRDARRGALRGETHAVRLYMRTPAGKTGGVVVLQVACVFHSVGMISLMLIRE
jgi:hypothetical protein